MAVGLAIVLLPQIAPLMPVMGVYVVEPALIETVVAQAQTVSIWDGYPKLKRICAVESTGDRHLEPRQFYPDGSIIWGKDPKTGLPIKRDVGACQINLIVWGTTARAMSLNVVHSIEDNITFGKWLYDHYGDGPWSASKDTGNGWNQPN